MERSTIFIFFGALLALAYAADTCENKDYFCSIKSTLNSRYCDDLDNILSCQKSCGYCDVKNNNHLCGISGVSNSRIVNGDDAVEGAWPWIVSLQRFKRHFCGGTILSPNWILTASHCVESFRSTYGLKVVLGAHKIDQDEKSQQSIEAKRIIMYGKYDKNQMNGDIALIELSSPARFNSRVKIPCMPNFNTYPKSGERCVVAGWGIINSNTNKMPTQLQQSILPVVDSPHAGCHNNKEVVCVGNGFNRQSNGQQHPNACRGDSGGPLVCLRNGKWQLEGVASYVHTYCKYYTAYAPVNKYLLWIKKYVPNL